MLLIILFLTTTLPGRIYGFEVGSGDEVSVDLCKLPDGVFPDPDNCEVFIRCQSSVPDVEVCPDKLLFNPLKLTCDFSKTGNCSDPNDFDDTPTPVQTNDVVCSEEGPNIYPIPSSCSQYYICENDTAFKVKCPGNLLMNADKITCDYPENVDCDTISSPEEPSVGIKAVYEDDKEVESETKNSVTFSSIYTSSASAKTTVQIKSETEFDRKEITGDTLLGDSDEDVERKSLGLTSTSNIKDVHDKIIPTSNSHKERSNLEDSTTENSETTAESFSDSAVTDLSSNDFRDYTSSESSESSFSFGDESVTAIQTSGKETSDTGSGSDIDIIDMFTTYTNEESQQFDAFTNDVPTSNTINTSVSNEHNLYTKAFSTDEKMTSVSLAGTLENVTTVDSEVEAESTTKITDNRTKYEGTGTKTPKSDVSLPTSYELTSQEDMTGNKASVDNLTSLVKTTESIVTNSILNESTTQTSLLSSLGSLDNNKNESYFQDTTQYKVVTEADSKIAPEKTLTTIQSLMSSDPLTDNETTKITTSTFSQTAKLTTKYLISTTTASTENRVSADAETSESKSHLDNQSEGYETLPESIHENMTLAPVSHLLAEESSMTFENLASSETTETSIASVVNTESLEKNNINESNSEDTMFTTSSVLRQQFNSTSVSPFISEIISTKDITSSVSIPSGHIAENDVGDTYFISTETESLVLATEKDNSTKTGINEEILSGVSHSTESSGTSDSYIPSSAITSTIFNKSESSMEVSHEDSVFPTNKDSTVSETQMNNSDVFNGLASENKDQTLTNPYFIVSSDLPTTQNIKLTEITPEETLLDLGETTKPSTEHPTPMNAFVGVTKGGSNYSGLELSTLKTHETIETIDLSSESDVTKVDQIYIDMYTNKSTSNLTNSFSSESFTDRANEQENLSSNFSTTEKSENLKLASSTVSTSSVSDLPQSTRTGSSSDLTNTLSRNETEVNDMNVTNELSTSLDEDFTSSESISKNSLINSIETGLPYGLHNSTLSETSTTPSTDVVTSTLKGSLASDYHRTSLDNQSEFASQMTETGTEIVGITVSTLGGTDPDYTVPTKNESTSTNLSIDTVNYTSATNFIHTASNEITSTVSETIFASIVSTVPIGDSSQSSKNTFIFQTTSDALSPRNFTGLEATLKSSEVTEALIHVTNPYILQSNSTKRTSEINEKNHVSEGTTEAFDKNTINSLIINIKDVSTIENKTNFTDIYEESMTSEAADLFETTKIKTVSSMIGINNETSESFWPKNTITVENNLSSIFDASTTTSDLRSVQSTISKETSTVNTEDLDDEASTFDISSPAVSYTKDYFASASDIYNTSKQSDMSTLSSVQLPTSDELISDSTNSSYLTLTTTYFNHSDNSVSTTGAASKNPGYDLNVTETSTYITTSTENSYSNEKVNPTIDLTSIKEMPLSTITELTSTKLNSKIPDTSETLQFTARIFNESSQNSQTNFVSVSRFTPSTQWPTKSITDLQTVASGSVYSNESTPNFTNSDVITQSTFKTSDITFTRPTAYNETLDPELVAENATFPSSDSVVSLTDIFDESTSLSSLNVTYETTLNKTETSHALTDSNSLSAFTNISMYSSEIVLSTVNPTEMSGSSVAESTSPFTDFKRETVSVNTETDVYFSTDNETESTDLINKIISTDTFTTKYNTEISRESNMHTTGSTNILVTEIGHSFSITDTTHDRTEENSLSYNRTTGTTPKTANTDSISIRSKTIPEETKETDFIFSTTDSSVAKTTERKTTSSKGTSESYLHTMSTTEMSVLINDTNEKLAESTTDFVTVPVTNVNIERETYSTEHASTSYFPPGLRTVTSYVSLNTDIASDNKEITSREMASVSQTTATLSKDISENTLPLVSTIETTVLNINDTNTITDSVADISNVSITSRNIIGKSEYTEYSTITYIPVDLRTQTSISSISTDTEREFQKLASTDIPSESTTTVNTVCISSEGNFPYPDDCNKFYRCTKGVPVLSSCVGNEHFHPVKRICTDPCLAKCDRNADCGTTESVTSAEESTSQTTISKDIYSTSESHSPGTEETSFPTTPDYFIEDTTLNKISKSTLKESSTITNSVSRSSILQSTEKLWTDSLSSDDVPSIVADNNATKDLTEITSAVYISSTSPERVTTSDSNPINSDVTISSTIVTDEITPETQTAIIELTSSTVKTSTGRVYETSSGSSEFTENTDITPESSGDGEDVSSTSTLITSTKCENEDCLSSKSQTSATLVPFRLCHRNDFLSLPNCNEYLDCTGKVPNKLECPKGLNFNPSTRVCDWPYKAECGKLPKPLYEPTDLFQCPCKSCLMPSTTSCSNYYLCIGFVAYEMKCSTNLYFDRSRNTCNFGPLVDCSALTSASTTTEIETYEISTKTSTIEISTTTKKASTTPASFVCPSREGLFSYPGNCGMFYQCSNWYPYVMRCAATTHFSEISKRCEFPCDAKCDSTLNCGSPSTAPPSDPRCSCLNCRLPSPESCTQYIVCVNGRARIEYCPWGKTFDARRTTCDWAHKVACRPSTMCPERNGLFSHKDDCHKFVHCSNGIPYVKNCPSILEFDPLKKRCEWPTERCNHLPIITRDVDYKNAEQRKGWKCPKTFGYYSEEQHCNKFYHCSFGTPTLKECSPGLLYNPRYQTCDWKKKVRCNSCRHLKPRKCRVFDHHVVCSKDRKPKPHVLCNMYYDCIAGRACAKQCPVGLYFNNITGVCDLPQNVKCLNPGEEDYSLKELSLKCASGEHARQVNPTNDSCFYHCRQGKVLSGCCSKGQVYNLHKDSCERRTKSLRI